MDETAPSTEERLVSPAEIARLAGVTRAAVSNWRRRHSDFPTPASGTGNSALFPFREVRDWLESQHKGQKQAEDAQLWDALRNAYGDRIIRGMAAVAELLADTEHDGPGGRYSELDPQTVELAQGMAASSAASEVVSALATRYPQATRRTASDSATPAGLVRAISRFVEGNAATVFDPACGIGALLAAVGGPGARRFGQDSDPDAARFAELRLELELENARETEIRVGDSLRDDRWPDLTAELVVCHPPAANADWGREDLLLDTRWELGVPPRAESELAWLQHAYAHTAPGGRAVVVMSASAAYRRTGRRIRAELVRRGLLAGVAALPAGLAASHAQPIHLWLLRRPAQGEESTGAASIRLTELTTADPDGPLEPDEHEQTEIAPIDLLDDAVDLTPGRHITGAPVDYPTEYETAHAELEQALGALVAALPELAAGSPVADAPQVRVSELARAGLVDLSGEWPVSVSDKLDTDFLRGFLLSPHNTRRSTSASGTFRVDTQGARIPQAGIEEQRRLGAAFRAVADFEARTKRFVDLAERAASLARDGLATGALAPKEGSVEAAGETSEDDRGVGHTE
ncbi:N-6 DNA methylase [Halostreptopolyspora alba]|uniref:SAM-dependent methyltransferase n=1 Tax=Halostreptopolyspora alba TaxID=2487137 RepID=A0A3N0EI22_9ACTN|nr:SAM-dependent methyltransferase [Nocardiopsaceae bacterium YIM 96095]